MREEIGVSVLSELFLYCQDHWKVYGRNYYCRYDYEGVSSESASTMMKNLIEKLPTLKGTEMKGMKFESAENFEYKDPVDKSVSSNQGIQNLACTKWQVQECLKGNCTPLRI